MNKSASQKQLKKSLSSTVSSTLKSLNSPIPMSWPIIVEKPILTPPWFSGKLTIDISMMKIKYNHSQHFSTILENCSTDTILYTDASKTTTLAGCAVVQNGEVLIHYPLPQYFSVLSSELFAIYLAITLLIEKPYSSAIICSDSLPAIKSLVSKSNPKIHPISQQILRLIFQNELNLQLIWVPGHKGIPGNEEADLAAKEATLISPIPHEPIPAQDLQYCLRQSIISSWSSHWAALPATHGLRAIQQTPKKWYSSSTLSRKQDILLRRLRIGHTALTHTHLLKGDPRPVCASCNVPLSVQHILLQCPQFTSARRQTNLSSNLPDILSSAPAAVTSLLNFLTTAKITP